MTQIIERVARAMCAADVPRPFDELQECDQDDYRDMAQAALKEIKFEQLVGALKRARFDLHSLGVEAYGDYPTETVDEMDALLSELEKTE